ncbi:cytidylate kinase [Bosea sp. BE125]|uniref:NACHT domain-containing protein n=1 Tax=Bosea sp. BE125 TaxID=2817909 RepID=UPI002860D8B5|nr:hypothetical protein [Bosea sp. BE125]MDR6873576.1 cytidylate kinase [Bosea sp. BE125]
MQPDYIPRMLDHGEGLIAEEELLVRHSVIVVLAEPGAGKTELLRSLAERLMVEPCRASLFRHRTIFASLGALVVDALDEVARTGQTAIDEVIVKARETQAAKVIFSSRSSEWDKARTQLVKECFGQDPAIIRLQPFNDDEQQVIFQSHLPGEDFSSFHGEAARFELLPLLGNPQFLKLFADAYVQGGRRFASKKQIFVDAVERLASERSTSDWQRDRPPTAAIVSLADEIFAKLMLSGASGVSVVDESDADFPYLNTLSAVDTARSRFALNTRLFKPANEPSHHEPVHRIVAEYCAARHLARQVSDPTSLLSLRRLMSVIAPNGVVRDELRGLLGWMAALGNAALQEVCIQADPYAVLANGDPSQLTAASKRLLLRRLKELAEIDPHFRRSDAWRRFSVAGFFSLDMVEELRELLGSGSRHHELRDLILELLEGSAVAPLLIDALQTLALDKDADRYSRFRALRLFAGIEGHDIGAGLSGLIKNQDRASLRLALEMAEEVDVAALDEQTLFDLLEQAGSLGRRRARRAGEDMDTDFHIRYHVKEVINKLELPATVYLLNTLTNNLTCTCGKKSSYTCECLPGPSKIVGSLLDRYFTLEQSAHDPMQIWGWIKPLVFSGNSKLRNSQSVVALRENHELRRAIQRLAFYDKPTKEEIWDARSQFWSGTSHAGLRIDYADVMEINDHAFRTANVALWESFYHRHDYYAQERKPDEYRHRLRQQAQDNPTLLRAWSKLERAVRVTARREPVHWTRYNRKWKEREERNQQKQKNFYRNNRTEIEAGKNWRAVRELADFYLLQPEKLTEFLDDIGMADRALLNSFEMLGPFVPSLGKLVKKRLAVTRVLHAACLATYRANGSLDGIGDEILRAVKTDSLGYPGVPKEEAATFESAIDRRLFPSPAHAEAYAREFIEPQLIRSNDAVTDVSWLDHEEAFKPLRQTLALEWLIRFPAMPQTARETLFGICAKHADRQQLNKLIDARCAQFITPDQDLPGASPERAFWFLRALFFLPSPVPDIWDFFAGDAQTIFSIEHRAGRWGRDEAVGWPPLSAEKVYRVLSAYVDAWPKVHLPSSHGTGSPPGETAYRFLTEVIYAISRDDPTRAVPVLDRMLADTRFANFYTDALGLKAQALRKSAHQSFRPPSPGAVVNLLDNNGLATVEDLRAFLIEELRAYQAWLRHAETNPLDVFYPGGRRLQENDARNRIVEDISARLSSRNLLVTIEHHMADANRCDITVAAMIDGRRHLLVIEVKGQWHSELFSAAATQLHDRYSVHPDAAMQGIYLVLWVGGDETIAGRRDPAIFTAEKLAATIDAGMPAELRNAIDVFALDLSRRESGETHPKRQRSKKIKATSNALTS